MSSENVYHWSLKISQVCDLVGQENKNKQKQKPAISEPKKGHWRGQRNPGWYDQVSMVYSTFQSN